VVLSCPVVCGTAIISNFQFILVNHHFLEGGIPLHSAPRVPPTAVCVEITCKDHSALPIDSLPAQLSCQCLSWRRVSLIINIDNPRYFLPTPPDIGDNNIVVSSPAGILPLINHQASPLSYRRPNSFSSSYFICQVADPYTSLLPRWLLQSHYIRLTFNPINRAAMLHSYDLAQLCRIALIIGSWGSRLSLSSSPSCSRTLGHRNVFCLPHCLLFLCFHQFRSASPLFFCSSLRPISKHHSVRPRCHASGCVWGGLPCWPNSLLCRATLAASVIFAHLLLNAMWFPLLLGHFSSVWLRSDPCFAVHPTTLQLWSLVQWWPEQWPHVGLLPRLFSRWPHPLRSSHLLSGPAFVYVST